MRRRYRRSPRRYVLWDPMRRFRRFHPIRKTKRRYRRWKRHWRDLPKKKRRLRTLSVLGPVVVVVAVVALSSDRVPEAPPPHADLTQKYRELSANVPATSRRILVAGDASASTVALRTGGRYDANGVYGSAYGLWECSFLAGPAVAGDDRVAPAAACKDWPEQFRAIKAGYRPDLVFFMVGRNQTTAHEVDGQVLLSGTPELAIHLAEQLETARKSLVIPKTRFVLATAPTCTGAVEPDRVQWLNEVLRTYAAAHPDTVTVADYGEWLCPGGEPGVTGTGAPTVVNRALTQEGGVATWEYVAQLANSG